MANHLWEKAKRDLIIKLDGKSPDYLVWEHSVRVSRIVDLITHCPEVNNRVINREALILAGLYHDVGWVLQVRKGDLYPLEVFLRPTTDVQCEIGGDWIEDQLSEYKEVGVIKTAAQAVRHMKDRSSDLLEAHILAEADNLDLVGPQALCLMIRKQLLEGRTIGEVIDSWRSQEEYGYWQARIKEGFRYSSVRQVAESRLQVLREFMGKLQESMNLQDLPQANESIPGGGSNIYPGVFPSPG